MKLKSLNLTFVSTPIGHIGSGRGGGVELTLISLIRGLISLGHKITLIAPEKSFLPSDCSSVEIRHIEGCDQSSWQHQIHKAPIEIPMNGVLPRLWEDALEIGKNSDAILNFGYDWLPIWVSQFIDMRIFHLISMGDVSEIMKTLIQDLSESDPNKFAFHTYRQAADYDLKTKPIVVGNGFELNDYKFQPNGNGPLGWVGRVSPEKGLEDAVAVANSLGEKLFVWGFMEDVDYASKIQASFPEGIIEFRGFLPTDDLQKELGLCRALINTPKWNEAYGNVVVEAMACGVPVVAYNRGGPGELIKPGYNGLLVPPDDVSALITAVSEVKAIKRKDCRTWFENTASKEVFAKRIEDWISQYICTKNLKT